MIYSIFADKDATIYSDYKNMNTGLDEILELRKSFYRIHEATIAETFTTASSLSRILIKFNLSDISGSISSGQISNAKFYLKLKTANAEKLALIYTASVYPLSQSWDMGKGKRQSYPIIQDGVTWNQSMTGSIWTGSSWYTQSQYTSNQIFSYETTDLNINVTNIVNAWISGTIANEGFVIKYPEAMEADPKEYGTLKFFSVDTHTIYPPTLEVRWDDSSVITASMSQLSTSDLDDVVVNVNGLKTKYTLTEKPRIRLIARERYPTKTFSTSSIYLSIKYLPTSSYYSIKDAHTEEVIVPFDTGSTKLSCDASGNYFNLWTSGMQPERYYKVLFKIVDGTREQILDKNCIFKLVR